MQTLLQKQNNSLKNNGVDCEKPTWDIVYITVGNLKIFDGIQSEN